MEADDASRLKTWRKSSGLSQKELGAALGRSQGYIGDIEAGRTGLSRDLIARLVERTSVNLEWLLTGVGPMDRDAQPPLDIPASFTKVAPPNYSMPMHGDVSLDGAEFSLVRRFDIGLSAGNGLVPVEGEEVDHIAFSRSWLIRQGLSASLCALVRVSGDSMAPTVPDGALALVNAAEMQVSREGIYAFSRGGEAFIKRIVPVGATPDGRPDALVIVSDNPSGASETLTGRDLLDIRIAGRVRCVIVSL